jgi:hypothetical protein
MPAVAPGGIRESSRRRAGENAQAERAPLLSFKHTALKDMKGGHFFNHPDEGGLAGSFDTQADPR